MLRSSTSFSGMRRACSQPSVNCVSAAGLDTGLGARTSFDDWQTSFLGGLELEPTLGGSRVSFAPKSDFSGSRFRANQGPSQAVRRENSKTQWCTSQMERSEQGGSNSSGSGAAGTGAQDDTKCSSPTACDDVDAQARAFQEGARAVDDLLQGIARSSRLDHIGSREEERRQLEQEEARRQAEADMRRARRREREARDPHRKVALKLENRRRFDAAERASTADHVPLCKVDFVGPRGPETVDLVDVGQLRSRCQQLNEGASVRSLMELSRRRDRLAKASPPPASNGEEGSLWIEATGVAFDVRTGLKQRRPSRTNLTR
eukprot:TRINITY_DN73680_c0_g1_i1.p1 TRINITY_DN73680_c0_g1~~TRINITY_DN73680_c0_g1_i1.p1  ORF type:complete len:318 (-),score=54.83 TRINITY_DN73680_c0_g1_i1:347-1300(-)